VNVALCDTLPTQNGARFRPTSPLPIRPMPARRVLAIAVARQRSRCCTLRALRATLAQLSGFVGVLLACAALAPASSQAAFSEVATMPSGSVSFVVASATAWAALNSSAQGGSGDALYVTSDAGAHWTQVPLPDPSEEQWLSVAAASDGTFRALMTKPATGVQVISFTQAGVESPLGTITPTSGAANQIAVDSDGTTWVAIQQGSKSPTTPALLLVSENGETLTVPAPAGLPYLEIVSTALGARAYFPGTVATYRPFTYAIQPSTYKPERGALVLAEGGPVELISGSLWLGSDAISWDSGADWVYLYTGNPEIRTIPRLPGQGSARFMLDDNGTVAQPWSPSLFEDSGLTVPGDSVIVSQTGNSKGLTHTPARVIDLGDALLAWEGTTVYQAPLPLPAPAASVGNLSPASTAMTNELNVFRTDAGLPPATGSATISEADQNQSNYTALNGDALGHEEASSAPGFTGQWPAERCAAVGALCWGEEQAGWSLTNGVATWMASVFHQEALAAPQLGEVGAAAGNASTHADWVMGLGSNPAGLLVGPAGFPNGLWRGSVTFSGGESPDPIADCAALGTPVTSEPGTPIVFYGPQWDVVSGGSVVSSMSVLDTTTGQPVPGCLLNDNPNAHFLPDSPLAAGHTYAVTANWDAEGAPLSYSWSFVVYPEPAYEAGTTTIGGIGVIGGLGVTPKVSAGNGRQARGGCQLAAKLPTRDRRHTVLRLRLRGCARSTKLEVTIRLGRKLLRRTSAHTTSSLAVLLPRKRATVTVTVRLTSEGHTRTTRGRVRVT
jgi:uncharacterized protein YkwD